MICEYCDNDISAKKGPIPITIVVHQRTNGVDPCAVNLCSLTCVEGWSQRQLEEWAQ